MTIIDLAAIRAARHHEMRVLLSLASNDLESQDRLSDLIDFPRFRAPVLSDETVEPIEA